MATKNSTKSSKKNLNTLTKFYKKKRLFIPEAECLFDVEKLVGESIPCTNFEDMKRERFGYIENNGHIIFLGLEDKNLTSLPDSICNLQYLEYLDLAGNLLSDFPNLIIKLKNLKEINLAGNYLHNISEFIQNFPISTKIWIFDSRVKAHSNNYTSKSPKKENKKEDNIIANKIPELFTKKGNNANANANANANESTELSLEIKNMIDRTKHEQIIKKNQNDLITCNSCNSRKFKTEVIVLDLVRKSPMKLVFIISAVLVKCIRCEKNNITINPTPIFLNRISEFTEILKKELRSQIKENCYCFRCREYYKYLERCPTHKIRLNIPPLVFIRGINEQYVSSRLLEK